MTEPSPQQRPEPSQPSHPLPSHPLPSSAQQALRDALGGLLRPPDGEPSPRDVADVLWMSRLAGLDSVPSHPGPVAPGPPSQRPPEQAADDDLSSGTETDPGRTGTPVNGAASDQHRTSLHVDGGPGAGGAPGTGGSGGGDGSGIGHAVRVAQPAALTGGLALARALRPLRRAVDAPGRATLDEEATAEAIAETGILLPAWRPAQQPHFAVDLLVDTGATMAVWHRLAGELATLLERHGAFADLRCWALGTDGPVPTLAPFHRRRPAASAPIAASVAAAVPADEDDPAALTDWSRPLNDPTGRRILLVLTDGVGPAWYGRALRPFLARVAATRPAAALQVLPRRLWHRTALRTAPVEARASVTGRPVPTFRSDAALPGVPRGPRGAEERARVRWLPVLEVDADWLAPWAELTAGRTSGWTPMLATPIDDGSRPQRPARPAEDPATPAERVDRFRAGSSPTAYRLACHLAASPLSLPVMRLVQRATVPESGQTDLAELFVSGLIEPYGGSVVAGDPDEQVYDFRVGVRKELLTELTSTESVGVLEQVLAKVSGRVAATFGGTLDFRAFAAGGAADGTGVRLTERSLPFAEVAVAVLAGAGGQHARLAATLADAVRRGAGEGGGTVAALATVSPLPSAVAPAPVLRRDRLDPVPPVLTPPDPPRMIGREHELDLMALVLTLPSLIVITGDPGTGRRRLIQEYIHHSDDLHPFHHRIDARSAESVERGLERLWSALSPTGEPLDDESLDPLWERLEQHDNWLIVFDGVPTTAWGHPGEESRVPFFLPPTRRGSVIVTTDAAERPVFPASATVIPLGLLTDEEVFEDLCTRLGQEYDPANLPLVNRLRRLARQLPLPPDLQTHEYFERELAQIVAESDRDRRAGAPDVTVHAPSLTPTSLSTLPPRSAVFAGRNQDLDYLLAFLAPAEPGTGAVTRTALVSGLPGVGKTQLVIQAAGLARDRQWYPGGVFYLDLAGTRVNLAVTPEQALEILLRTLGVPSESIPADLRERADAYRSALAARTSVAGPVLLVLDDVASAAQVTPLLPTDGPVTVLVGSRHILPIEARRYSLEVMTPGDSLRLLADRLRSSQGTEDTRIGDDPQQALQLARLCGHLPLALTICAALLADLPSRPLSSLVQRLEDPRFRLDRLKRGDQGVRAALIPSYWELPTDQARLFRLLPLHPGSDLSTEAAAALADIDVQTAEEVLGELARTHLVNPGRTWGRWHMHDLVRLYATELGEAGAADDDRAGATARLVQHYRSMVDAAVTHLRRASDTPPSPFFRDPDDALIWLRTERPNLVALLDGTAPEGSPVSVAQLIDLVSDLVSTSRSEPARAEGALHLAIELELVGERHRAATENWRNAALAVEGALSDILRAEAIDATVTPAAFAPEVDLLVALPDSPDPLAAAGVILLRLSEDLNRRHATASPGRSTHIGVALYSTPLTPRVPAINQLKTRLSRVRPTPYVAVPALTVSQEVLDMINERLDSALEDSFDQIDLVPPESDAAASYIYTGDVRLLARLLARPQGPQLRA